MNITVDKIYLKNIASTELGESAIVLKDREPAIGRIGAKTYLVIGDGVKQAKNLPRFAADYIAEWGSITGAITAQADLMTLFAAKLDGNLGAANIGKILVVGEDGGVRLTVNNFMEKPASAVAGNIAVLDSGKNVADGGKSLNDYYTRGESETRYATKTELGGKLDANLGAASANKLIGTDASGDIVAVTVSIDGGIV